MARNGQQPVGSGGVNLTLGNCLPKALPSAPAFRSYAGDRALRRPIERYVMSFPSSAPRTAHDAKAGIHLSVGPSSTASRNEAPSFALFGNGRLIPLCQTRKMHSRAAS